MNQRSPNSSDFPSSLKDAGRRNDAAAARQELLAVKRKHLGALRLLNEYVRRDSRHTGLRKIQGYSMRTTYLAAAEEITGYVIPNPLPAGNEDIECLRISIANYQDPICRPTFEFGCLAPSRLKELPVAVYATEKNKWLTDLLKQFIACFRMADFRLDDRYEQGFRRCISKCFIKWAPTDERKLTMMLLADTWGRSDGKFSFDQKATEFKERGLELKAKSTFQDMWTNLGIHVTRGLE